MNSRSPNRQSKNQKSDLESSPKNDDGQEEEEEEEKDLTLFQILLSTFIKEPSTVFQSEGDLLYDQSGTPFIIYTENGITYITRGSSNRKKKKSKYKKTFVLPSEDSSHNEDSNEIIEKLTEFTQTLKNFTEEVNDIKITKFSLTWGLQNEDDTIPYLLNCDNSKYLSTSTSKPYIAIITQIVLFNAVEISRVPIPGKCFVNGKNCLSCEKSIIRNKLLQPKIEKLVSQFEYVNDKHSCEKYIQNRLNALCPTLLMSIIPVCRRCYAKCSESNINRLSRLQLTRINTANTKERSTTRSKVGSLSQKTSKHPDPIRKRVNPSDASTNINSSTRSASNSSRPGSGVVRNIDSSYLKYTKDPQSVTARAMYYNRYTRKSPSGLTYSQNYSDVSVYRAHKLYSSLPFQVFPKPC